MAPEPLAGPPVDSVFSRRHRESLVVTGAVVVSYIGYYFLRSHIGVSITAIEDAGVLTKEQYGVVIGTAYMMNVIGKASGGIVVDVFNRPKTVFLVALLICGVVTVINTFWTSVVGFTVLVCALRLATSFGWSPVVKLIAAWWPTRHMGTILGIASVSCCVGEFATKMTLGAALAVLTWEQVYYLATAIAMILALPTVFVVRDTPLGPLPPCEGYEHEALVPLVPCASVADAAPLLPRPSPRQRGHGASLAGEADEPLLGDSAHSYSGTQRVRSRAGEKPLVLVENYSVTDPRFFEPLRSRSPARQGPLEASQETLVESVKQERRAADDGVKLPIQLPLQRRLVAASDDVSGLNTADDSVIDVETPPGSPGAAKSRPGLDMFLGGVLLPLLRSPRFLLILFMALCTAVLRETINNWFTVYLRDMGVSPTSAGMLSSIPSAFGGVSTFIGGYLVDRVPRHHRGLIAVTYLTFMTGFLVLLILFTKFSTEDWGVTLRATVATSLITGTTFSMWAPYSFLDGVFIVDLIGTKGVAFGAGIVGAIGYFGAFFTMMAFGRMVQTWDGWVNVWMINGAGSLVTLVASVFYWLLDRGQAPLGKSVP